MSINALQTKLEREGFAVEAIRIADGTKEGKPGLRVRHDYEWKYPTAEARQASAIVTKMARRAGYDAEPRGYLSATWVF